MSEIKKRFKIIYIIGTGRNGSTLLDVVLGNSDKIQSTGELKSALRMRRANRQCSCGKKVSDCIFWSEVQTLIEKKYQVSDLLNISKIQNHLERNILFPSQLLFNKVFYSNKIKLYKQFLKELYTAISVVSKKPVLVDSSTNPLHGYMLLDIFKNNVYFIHLVRDGRGQLWSWMKMGHIPLFNISLRKKSHSKKEHKEQYYWWGPYLYAIAWVFYNLFSLLVIWKGRSKKSIRIKYEEFCKDPLKYIRIISELVDEDLSDLVNLFEKNESFIPNHLLAGNRLRMIKQITVRPPDEEWKTKLPEKYKRSFWLIASGLSRLYGYKFKNWNS